jgi:hypothetical protein
MCASFAWRTHYIFLYFMISLGEVKTLHNPVLKLPVKIIKPTADVKDILRRAERH